MISPRQYCKYALVALLAEGVDRNFDRVYPQEHGKESPSSRRAWIEMSLIA